MPVKYNSCLVSDDNVFLILVRSKRQPACRWPSQDCWSTRGHMATQTWFPASVLQDLRQCFAKFFVISSEEIAHFAVQLLGRKPSPTKTDALLKIYGTSDHFLNKHFHCRFSYMLRLYLTMERCNYQLVPRNPQYFSLIQGDFFNWSRPKSSKYGTGPTQ